MITTFYNFSAITAELCDNFGFDSEQRKCEIEIVRDKIDLFEHNLTVTAFGEGDIMQSEQFSAVLFPWVAPKISHLTEREFKHGGDIFYEVDAFFTLLPESEHPLDFAVEVKYRDTDTVLQSQGH